MEITLHPGNESPRVLRALAAMLITLADNDNAIAPGRRIDRPDVGKEIDAAMSDRPINPAQAFGAGNVGAVSFPIPAPIGAASSVTIPPIPVVPPAPTDAASPDPAAVFGGGIPNVPPPPPSGTPPVPNSGGATAGAPTPANGNLMLDADGLPWEARIHSSSKGRNADGRWKAKRNVPDATIAAVQAELRAALSVPSGNAPPPPIPMPTASPGITLGGGASDKTFPMLLPRVTSALAAGTLTQELCGQILAQISGGKVTSVAMLAVTPQLIPTFWAQLDAMGVA